MTADKKPIAIQTPSGEIAFKLSITTKNSFDDAAAELTSGDFDTLSLAFKKAPDFIGEFVASDRFSGDILEDLDLAFAAWLKSGNRDRFTTNDVIQIVGSALGFYSISRLGVRWARVTDAHGTDIALVATNPPTRSYPFSSVQYRIEDNKTDFIVALYRTLEYNMKNAVK